MSQEPIPNQPPSTPPPPPVDYATPTAYTMPQDVIDQGKAFAVLSYVLSFFGLPFWVVPLVMRDNAYSLYHAKQALMVWLLGVVGIPIAGLSILICVGIVLAPVVVVLWLVLNIIGLIRAINGEARPLPLIGPWGEQWFAGIQPQPK